MFRRGTAVCVCLTALVAVTLPAAAGAAPDAPQVGQRQWLDCNSAHLRGAAPYSVWPTLWQAQADGDAQRVALLERIAHVPQAKWLAGQGVREEPSRIVGDHVENILATQWGGPNCRTEYRDRAGASDPYTGDYPVFATRMLRHDDCSSSYDGGGAWNRANDGAYLPWLERVIDALAPLDHRATIIIETDGLPVIRGCLSRGAARQRLALMRAVSKRLGAVPNLASYLDIGSSAWLSKREAARYLRRAGVRYIRGFALNSTHFNHTRGELRYGDALARRLGKRYVVNTAENGRGGLKIKNPNKRNIKNRFCNPVNAGLGSLPTTRTASRYADAYLWISRPGLSSNGQKGNPQCSRGPTGNVFWFPKAQQEARLASFDGQPPWPPAPL